MIILFEENATEFTTLGLGVLKDATKCLVSESLNDTFELGLEYPITGLNYDKIKINRILFTKVDPYNEGQPFRIIGITKPIKGIVTVTAVHVSYDMNGLPVKPIDGQNLLDTLSKIQNETLLPHNFNFISQVSSGRTYKTTAPYNMRALFMGGDDSVLNKYDLEVKFDKFNVILYQKRGADRGSQVKYAHNMVDLSHVSNVDNLYNGVFPYYHAEKTSTETNVDEGFTQAYIVGSKPYQSDWLSYTKDGEPFIPLDESPIQIVTEGDYYQKVYVWNELYQNFIEKIYNEQVMVIQGILEPTWISIDWSKFPTVICRANRKGYFKKGTDTDWGDIRGVGDVIFEDSIVSSGIMENLIIYFSEVIPTTGDKENTEVTEIVDVQLDDPIIWIDTIEAKQMLHNNILCLDLSSEFEEEPSKERLKAKAEEYINENKLGVIKHTTTVSFIDLAATTDAEKYQNFEHIELGDTVRVIYDDLGVNVSLRVIKVDYDVLNDRYDKIELGEKEEKMSSSSVQTGDNVSALTNDASYASVTTVHKLIAETVTANYIEALNAKLSTAQIGQLEVERINATGIIEASQFSLDTIIAKLLIAENAQIAQTLTAGQIKVAGDIEIFSGRIRIEDENANTSFVVDRSGNVTANSVTITGGTLNINEGVFEVTNDGVLTATAANITGTINAKDGTIGGFTIDENKLYHGDIGESGSVYVSPNVDIPISIAGSPDIPNWAFTAGSNFGVTTNGVIYANDVRLRGGDTIFDILGTDGTVTINNGKIIATNGEFIGEIRSGSGIIGGFTITNDSLTYGIEGASDSIILKTGEKRKYYNGYVSSNKGVHDSYSVIKITVTGLSSLTIYIRNSSEIDYDYIIASKVNASSFPVAYNDANAYKDCKDISDDGTTIEHYKKVIYNNLVDDDFVYVVYRKDGSEYENEDEGYVLIPDDSTHITLSNITGQYTFNNRSTLDLSVLNNSYIKVGENFYVNGDGDLTATNVTLTGNITATSGKVGPLTVTTTSLRFETAHDEIFKINPTTASPIANWDVRTVETNSILAFKYITYQYSPDTINTYYTELTGQYGLRTYDRNSSYFGDSNFHVVGEMHLDNIKDIPSFVVPNSFTNRLGMNKNPKIEYGTMSVRANGAWDEITLQNTPTKIVSVTATYYVSSTSSAAPDASGNLYTSWTNTRAYLAQRTTSAKTISYMVVYY